MGQETRKDPRAKVLTMTVRYKSATLDEFIEHHSHDVSRGGMFIKTPSPFPPGTLLKFEVKIAEDQKVIQGVGRVVWKRESDTGDKERPNGMGVKFIKIDDVSRKTIDTLVDSRGDAGAAYEAGGGDGGSGSLKTAPGATPAAAMTPAMPESASGKPPMVRKATMIGLGAMGSHAAAAAAKAAESAPPPAAGGGMFPDSDSEADMPAPEDRTVMKQAAELLQDALREAGGSMDDVGTKPDSKKASLKPEPERKSQETEPELAPKAVALAAGDKGPHTLRSEPPKSEKKPEQKAASARPAAASERPRSERPAASARPSTRTQPILSEAPQASEGGGGRIMIILAGIAVAAGAVFFLTKKEPTPPVPAPEPPAVVAPVALPVEEPKPPEPAPSAVAPAESASAAPAPSAAVAPSAVPAPPAAKPAPVTPPAAVAPTPKPKPVLQKPRPKPAPVAADPDAAPDAPAPPKPAEPAPKPKPADTSGDNPY